MYSEIEWYHLVENITAKWSLIFLFMILFIFNENNNHKILLE
jgi:hypothetical protein